MRPELPRNKLRNAFGKFINSQTNSAKKGRENGQNYRVPGRYNSQSLDRGDKIREGTEKRENNALRTYLVHTLFPNFGMSECQNEKQARMVRRFLDE